MYFFINTTQLMSIIINKCISYYLQGDIYLFFRKMMIFQSQIHARSKHDYRNSCCLNEWHYCEIY